MKRLWSVWLIVLLAGASASPHRHKNDLADLLTEAPSNSGVFLGVAPIVSPGDPPLAESLRWIHDAPCPACFPFDFATTAAATPQHGTILVPLDRIRALPDSGVRSERIGRPASRSPPSR